ncbi:centrosome-associated protein CEP250-like [Callorhinchus milii]|uniref:centrosome-associated protein CEP250-like n=1 Tax=Callorhinchus milii TaxID=7868 RepID=UPI001C3FBA75|nr:centrosome-associated protein CEP250-like [Callorhinchus milii]
MLQDEQKACEISLDKLEFEKVDGTLKKKEKLLTEREKEQTSCQARLKAAKEGKEPDQADEAKPREEKKPVDVKKKEIEECKQLTVLAEQEVVAEDEDTAKLKTESAGTELEECKTKLKEAEDVKIKQTAELEEAKQSLKTTEDSIEKKDKERDTCEEEIKAAKLTKCQMDLKAAEKDDNNVKALEEDLEKKKADLADCQKELKAAQEKAYDKLTPEVKKLIMLQDERKACEMTLDKLEKANMKKLKEFRKVDGYLEEKKKLLTEREKEQTSCQARLNAAKEGKEPDQADEAKPREEKKPVDVKKKEIEECKKLTVLAEQEVVAEDEDTAKLKTESAGTELEECKTKLKEAELEEAKQSLKTTEESIDKKDKELKELKERLKKGNDKNIKALEEVLEKKKAELADCQKELKAAQKANRKKFKELTTCQKRLKAAKEGKEPDKADEAKPREEKKPVDVKKKEIEECKKLTVLAEQEVVAEDEDTAKLTKCQTDLKEAELAECEKQIRAETMDVIKLEQDLDECLLALTDAQKARLETVLEECNSSLAKADLTAAKEELQTIDQVTCEEDIKEAKLKKCQVDLKKAEFKKLKTGSNQLKKKKEGKKVYENLSEAGKIKKKVDKVCRALRFTGESGSHLTHSNTLENLTSAEEGKEPNKEDAATAKFQKTQRLKLIEKDKINALSKNHLRFREMFLSLQLGEIEDCKEDQKIGGSWYFVHSDILIVLVMKRANGSFQPETNDGIRKKIKVHSCPTEFSSTIHSVIDCQH